MIILKAVKLKVVLKGSILLLSCLSLSDAKNKVRVKWILLVGLCAGVVLDAFYLWPFILTGKNEQVKHSNNEDRTGRNLQVRLGLQPRDSVNFVKAKFGLVFWVTALISVNMDNLRLCFLEYSMDSKHSFIITKKWCIESSYFCIYMAKNRLRHYLRHGQWEMGGIER